MKKLFIKILRVFGIKFSRKTDKKEEKKVNRVNRLGYPDELFDPYSHWNN